MLLAAAYLPAQMDSPIVIGDSGIPIELKGASKQVVRNNKATISPLDFIVVRHDKRFNPNGPTLEFRDQDFRAYCLEGAASTKIKLSNLRSWSAKLTLVTGNYLELKSAMAPYHVDFDTRGNLYTPPIGPASNGLWASFLLGIKFNSVSVTTDPATPYRPYMSTGVTVHYCSNNVPCNPDPCP
jgi:hypothetical protein